MHTHTDDAPGPWSMRLILALTVAGLLALTWLPLAGCAVVYAPVAAGAMALEVPPAMLGMLAP